MKRILVLLVVAALCFAGAGLIAAQPSPMHPTFPLLDASGANVLDSGAPVSTLMTCGSCHDVEFITSHTKHGDGGRTSAGALPPDTLPATSVEMNCFLCHTVTPNNTARLAAIAAENMLWANTATLDGSGIVTAGADGTYTYNADAFAEDGALRPEFVTLQDPTSNNCGSCHGQVHLDNQTPLALSVCEVLPMAHLHQRAGGVAAAHRQQRREYRRQNRPHPPVGCACRARAQLRELPLRGQQPDLRAG